ncbi:MAG: O-antigen ligase family protein [Clostridium sp.]|nr:O-antigen ligase family protein [Clostridium sp.]
MKISLKKNQFLDYYAIFYLFIDVICTYIGMEFGLVPFFIFFILAVPFYKGIEHFISIVLLLSTISYYFFGAYENILSIHTILVFVSIISLVMKKTIREINLTNGFAIVSLCVVAYISYSNSPYGYLSGLFRVLYILISTYIVGAISHIDLKKLSCILPKLASTLLWLYAIIITLNPVVDSAKRLSLSENVNGNTFAMSCAISVCVVFLDYYMLRGKKLCFIKILTLILGLILILLSGSRTALMATVLSCAIIMIIKAKREKRLEGTIFKLAILGIFVIAALYVVATVMNLDISRYNYIKVIQSGGTNRATIYQKLIPFIFDNQYYIYGYGPGHDCTRQILLSLVNRNYAHSHNTFLEAFGELGGIGLVLTVICTITSFRRISNSCIDEKSNYIMFGILLCILISSVGESYFCYAVYWIILLICRQSRGEKRRKVI